MKHQLRDDETTCECCGSIHYDDDLMTLSDAVKDGRKIELCDDCVEEICQHHGWEFDSDVIFPDVFDGVVAYARRNLVLVWSDERICTVDQVEEFFDALTGYLGWHPDTKFDEYVHKDTGERLFDDAEALKLDTRMVECFGVCRKARKTDIYELGMEAFQRAGVAPKPEEAIHGSPATDAEMAEENALLKVTQERDALLAAAKAVRAGWGGNLTEPMRQLNAALELCGVQS